jgi:hypothetical protein
MLINRRGLITGLVSFVAAPAIVRAGSLMPVRSIVMPAPNPYHAMPGDMAVNDEGLIAVYDGTNWRGFKTVSALYV